LNIKGAYEGIRWIGFDRQREGRRRELVLKYAITAGSWRSITAPADVTSEVKFRAWAIERLTAVSELGDEPVRKRGGSTVAELYERWIENREKDPDVSGATADGNRTDFRSQILPRWGQTALAELDSLQARRQLREWVRELAGKVSPVRCRNVVSSFTTFVRDAKLEGWVTLRTNPLVSDEVTTVLPSLNKGPVVTLPVDVAQALLDCPRVELRRAVRYIVALCTGAADGELAGLRVSDVVGLDSGRPSIQITKAYKLRGKLREDGVRGAQLGKPKNDYRLRPVPLNRAAAAALRDWLEFGWEAWVGMPPEPNKPLFPDALGSFSRPRMSEYLREDLALAEQPTADAAGHPYEFRALRRTFSTMLARAGVHREIRERLMGQRSDSVNTEHYTGAVPEELAESVEKIPLCWRRAGLGDHLVAPPGGTPTSDPGINADAAVPEDELRNRCSTTELRWPDGKLGELAPLGAARECELGEKGGSATKDPEVTDHERRFAEALAEDAERVEAFALATRPLAKGPAGLIDADEGEVANG
jgi:integrase